MNPATSHDSETPAHGQQVITVVAFLHHKFDGVDKVFLARRAATKKFLPGIYELPGGHVDFREDIKTALQREISEEFKMDCTVGDPFYAFTDFNEIKGAHYVEVTFFAQFTGPLDHIHLDPADHSDYVWLAADEIHQAINDVFGPNDPEQLAMKQGFALLAGGHPLFK